MEATGDLYLRDSDYSIVQCPSGVDCLFHWKETSTPEVTAWTLENGVFTCTGVGFPELVEDLELFIGGRK